jgi:uncharacterized Zn-binding protein involved in type VI secretion
MPAAHRHTDICTGHGCWPPRPNIQGSPDVFVNGLGWHRKTDLWDVHCCPPCHDGSAQDGSSTVFVNGLRACRVGDPVDCGSYMAGGSPNVFAGD